MACSGRDRKRRAQPFLQPLLTPNSCGCGRARMHAREPRGAPAGGRGRGKNVCGADCGNVISRYVAVGRPSSPWHRHLPTSTTSPLLARRRRRRRRQHASHENVERGPLEFLSSYVSFLASSPRVPRCYHPYLPLVLASFGRGSAARKRISSSGRVNPRDIPIPVTRRH